MPDPVLEKSGPRELLYEGVHCTLMIKQILPKMISVRISGRDVGEFGDAPFVALDRWLDGGEAMELFIDARDVRGASIDVSSEWALWLGARKEKLAAITMLTGSPLIHITAEFVRRFAALEGVMRICTQADVFENTLREAVKAHLHS